MHRWFNTLISIASVTALAIAQPVYAAAPTCQYLESDSDGDGWGWESNTSCIVTADTESLNTVIPQVTGSTGQTAQPEPEPESDIKVEPESEPATTIEQVTQPDPELTPLYNGKHPICTCLLYTSDAADE